MKNPVFTGLRPALTACWGEEEAQTVLTLAEGHLQQLCRNCKAEPKAVRRHTLSNIYPTVSIYRALQDRGIPAPEALQFLDRETGRMAEPGARRMQKLLRHFGLYRLYPALFRMTARRQYGTAAGFSARFYACGRGRCKFDMTRCLFLDTCTRCGCPELTRVFCHVDDVNNCNLHPRLCWNRTRYMGGGGELCDFDIFVTDKKCP